MYRSSMYYSSESDFQSDSESDYFNYTVVFFDLKTSGLRPDNDILQIAACTRYDKFNKFNVYVRPRYPVKNVEFGFYTTKGDLYFKNQRLNTVSIARAVKLFVKYLQSLNTSVVLVAHQGIQFDAPRILRQVWRFDLLNEFAAVVHSFSDSLSITRHHLPQRRRNGQCFQVKSLAMDLLSNGNGYDTCNATSTNAALVRIFNVLGIKDYYILNNSKRTMHVFHDM